MFGSSQSPIIVHYSSSMKGRKPAARENVQLKKERACKPGSVHGNPVSLPSLCIRRRRLMSSDLPAVSPRSRAAGWAIHRCSILLTMRFAMPCPLPDMRWALTPPFHPCHRWRYIFCGTFCPATALIRRTTRSAEAESNGAPYRSATVPDVIRHRALMSPDFPRNLSRSLAAARLALNSQTYLSGGKIRKFFYSSASST